MVGAERVCSLPFFPNAAVFMTETYGHLDGENAFRARKQLLMGSLWLSITRSGLAVHFAQLRTKTVTGQITWTRIQYVIRLRSIIV